MGAQNYIIGNKMAPKRKGSGQQKALLFVSIKYKYMVFPYERHHAGFVKCDFPKLKMQYSREKAIPLATKPQESICVCQD